MNAGMRILPSHSLRSAQAKPLRFTANAEADTQRLMTVMTELFEIQHPQQWYNLGLISFGKSRNGFFLLWGEDRRDRLEAKEAKLRELLQPDTLTIRYLGFE